MVKNNKQVPRAEWPEIIGPKDLQELTGGVIGRRTAYDLFAEPGFPKVVIGNKWLCKSEDFWSWWDNHKGKTTANEDSRRMAEAQDKLDELGKKGEELAAKYHEPGAE